MPDEYVGRKEFNESLNRFHVRVDGISKDTTEIKTYAKSMKETTDKLFECVYGNGKEGLLTRITKCFERLGLHTKIISCLIFSILAIAFCIIQNSLNNIIENNNGNHIQKETSIQRGQGV